MSYYRHNHDEQALEILKKSVELAAAKNCTGHELFVLNVYPLMTKIYLKQNKLAEAIRWHKKSAKYLAINEINGYTNREVLSNQAIILEKQGAYHEALMVFHRLQHLHDSLAVQEKSIEILQINALAEVKNQEDNIELLNQSLGLKQQLLERTQRQQLYLVIIIFLLGLVGVSMIFLVRYIQQKRRTEQAQKRQLEIQSQQLLESNQMKDKLFSIIGHDLRSPVADLNAVLTLFNRTKNMSSEKLLAFTQKLQVDVEIVHRSLDNLLQWSLTQLKGLHTNIHTLDLQLVIQEMLNQFEERARQKEILLLPQISHLQAQADENQLRIILQNLVSNAIKFTPRGGYIRISTIQLENMAGIVIQDTGVGMNVEQLQKVFNFPESKRGTAGEKGTGLGLRLCRELIENLSGKLMIESDPMKGTKVSILLPILLNCKGSTDTLQFGYFHSS